MPTLKLEDLTLGYGQHPCVLRNISFDAAPGEWIVIAGASGSGKSTLMKGVAGLLPRTEGLLHRFGHIVPAGAGQLDGRISLVFQNPNHQFLGATPRDDLRWGLRQRGIPTHQAEQRITAIFHQLQITELADQPLHELSLGQRRLVALSAALSTLPDLLLCDELTNGLDPVNAHRVLTAVEAARTTGTTVIWVTHELHRLPAAAHRVLLMREGSLIFDGPRHLGLRPENLQKTGLWVAPRDYQNTYHNHFDEPDFNHDTPRGD